MHFIQPLDDTQKVKQKTVNQQELFDLKRSSPQSELQDSGIVDDQIPALPLLFLDNTFKGETTSFSPITHPYNTRLKNKTAAAGRQAVVEIQVMHL